MDVFEAFKILTNKGISPFFHPDYVIADALRDKNLKPEFFVFRREDQVFYHGFHLSEIEGTSWKDIQSPYGYGGPISTTNDRAFLDQAFKAYEDWCRQQNVLVEFVRFHPLVKNADYYSGQVVSNRQTVYVDLAGDLLNNYSGRARTAIKKAQNAGLRIEWPRAQDFLPTFDRIYRASLDELKAQPFYYFPMRLYERLLDSPIFNLALCYKSGDIVGAALFLINVSQMEYYLSATTSEGKKEAANNLLLHEAFLKAKELGVKAAHLGGGTDSSPDNPLLFFKASFSPLRGDYKIGSRIYDQKAYDQLKFKWEEARGLGSAGNRILFYRG